MDAIIQQLLGNGVLGVLAALLFWWVNRLSNRNDEIQDKRIEEARITNDVIRNNTVSQDANTEATKALGEFVKRLDEDIRGLREDIRRLAQ